MCVSLNSASVYFFSINKMIIRRKKCLFFLWCFIDYHHEMQWVEAQLFIFSLAATNTVLGGWRGGSDTTSDVCGGLRPGRSGLTFRLAEQKP